MIRKILRFLLPLIVIVIGIGISARVVKSKPQTKKAPPVPVIPYVDVVKATPVNSDIQIEATGAVIAAKEVDISSELAGKIVYRAPQLETGGIVKKGITLFKVDARDYELAIAQEQTRVKQAEVELQLEAGRRKIAEAEWAMLGDERSEEEAALALRIPQMEAALQQVEAAKSGLARATLNLERTRTVAPFTAMVITENIERGQVVAPGAPLAKIVATGSFWVRSSIPVEQINQIFIPGTNAKKGSEVEVYQVLSSGRDIVRKGRVLRIAGPLDQENRTAQILIEVKNPLTVKKGQLPLLPGAFVEVVIRGKTIKNAFAVPRGMLYDGNKVWKVDTTKSLVSSEINIAWRSPSHVFAIDGIQDGEMLLKTKLAMPIKGMKVTYENVSEEEEVNQ